MNAHSKRRRLLIQSQQALTVGLSLLFLVACITTSKFQSHYDAGAVAADAGDYEVAIQELEAAVAIKPDQSSFAWHKLAFCYHKVNRHADAWEAMRYAVLLSPENEDRQTAFFAMWQKMRERLKPGDSVERVVAWLGEPDFKAVEEGNSIWQYGLVTLQIESGQVTAFKRLSQFEISSLH